MQDMDCQIRTLQLEREELARRVDVLQKVLRWSNLYHEV